MRFVSRAQGLTVLIKDGEATLLAPSDGHDRTPALVHMKLVGGSLRDPVALEKQDGVSNYLMGDRPSDLAVWNTEFRARALCQRLSRH